MIDQHIIESMDLHRKELHKIPELGLEEFKTYKYVTDVLRALGYETEMTAGTGVLAYKKGSDPKKTVAFRCDMDALTIDEKSECEYKSTHQGRMHACGHDGHMAIMLGFAEYLCKIKTNDNILMIFQPGEESPGGARIIVEEGVLERYGVDCVFGLHIFPTIEEGKVGIKPGPQMATAAELDIRINGKSAHGAMPQNGADSICAAANLISTYQTIISRSISPLEPAVITLGKINGGSARNILAESVKISGTIRTFSKEVLDIVRRRIGEINEGVEKSFGVDIDCNILEMYPPVVNDEKLFELVKSSLSDDDYIISQALMTAEDFSYYQQEVPGFFFLLGSKNEEKGYVHPLHNSRFDFDSNVLETGLSTYIKICRTLGTF